MGTKKSSRPFLAPRLIARLTGPARLLAMSWSQVDFRGKSGVKTLLTRLAESPLVRKNLPNTSAVMNQYFNYKRFPNETIANYLVRESLYFEEFNESLLALKEEQEGGLSQNIFDFSDSSSESDDEDEDGSTKKSKGYQKVHFEAATWLASSFWSLLDSGGVACCAVIYEQQAGLPEHQHGLDHPL